MASFTRLHPLASQALETSLDAISQNREFATNTPADPAANMPASPDIIKELRDEMETLRGRLESIEK